MAFFLLPILQIMQLFRGTVKARDVSYIIFVLNGTMSIFFCADFWRISDIIAFIPQAISKNQNAKM